ncbi:Zn(2)-C6 fungal-type domain-containing protein [Mycena indigotica]|uniref:Zn(2)-C6 fungal-type domain-containing protein n=1 Tax=Mycena indigotica TaxID=2126181 RepID=A0A8H6T642_9AGAR|nr:Zn(2)-C6 fungal-type domain-containing protein [Mycena indigotica]KAF7311753.1 Zn(2)-C6 fungal-type domain-containing protein [Mycena indigotica]
MSAISHVVIYLTRPLSAAGVPATSVATAQAILHATLSAQPSASGILTLAPLAAPPTPLLAAAIGAAIQWPVWYHALAGDAEELTVVYGPGFVKARIGAGPLFDVWSEETQGSVVRISRQPQAPALSLAFRRRPIVLPTLFATPYDDNDSSSDDDDSDAASDASSSPTVYSLSPDSPKGKPFALPAVAGVRPLPAVPKTVPVARALPVFTPEPALKPATKSAGNTTTAYLYKGGVTRVMTGGVMLGPRAPAKPRATRIRA